MSEPNTINAADNSQQEQRKRAKREEVQPQPPPPVELRLAVLTGKRGKGKKAAGASPPPRPHFRFQYQPDDAFCRLVKQLPDSTLRLTRCTITVTATTSDANIPTVETASCADQQAFDEMVAGLPLRTALTVAGTAMQLGATQLMVHEAQYSLAFALQAADMRVSQLYSASCGGSDSAGEATTATAPPIARFHRGHSISLIRLLPSLTLSIRTQLYEIHTREATVLRVYDERGAQTAVFEAERDSDIDALPAQLSISVADVLAFHEQRVLVAHQGKKKRPQPRSKQELSLDAFLALCPAARLESCAADFNNTVTVRVQSTTDVQLRGFHIVRPQLRLSLWIYNGYSPWSINFDGQGRAAYTLSDGDPPVECCADVSMTNGPDMRLSGDCLSVMRMGDVLTASFLLPASRQPSSLTALRNTLDFILSQQLPWLVPSSPPVGDSDEQRQAAAEVKWNQLDFSYDHNLEYSYVQYHDLTLDLIDCAPTASSPAAPPYRVLLDTPQPLQPNLDRTWKPFRLRPYVQFGTGLGGRGEARLVGTTPLAQLLRLLGMRAERVPTALLERVQLSEVDARLVVPTAGGAACCIAGTAKCGRCVQDELVFFRRFTPAAPAHIVAEGADNAANSDVDILARSPIRTWLRLQCRPVLNAAIFPQLATLTAGRCLEPVYQYVLCETDGGVQVTAQQTAAWEDACRRVGNVFQHATLVRPLTARPTDAVFAFQPHLPSGCIELPATALTLPAATHDSASQSSSSSIPAPSPPYSPALSTCLLVQLAEHSADLLRLCADFLDATSILHGLLPALYSLPSVSTSIDNSTYGRRVLLSRYGAYSDAALWSAELLSAWRRDSEQQQQQQATTQRRDAHWAAVAELQRRVNRFLVGVMRQAREDVLPQLYPRHSISIEQPTPQDMTAARHTRGRVRPVYTTAPDAALELLLCIPPFHTLPDRLWRYQIPTIRQLDTGHRHMSLTDTSLVNIMRWQTEWLWSLYTGPVYVYDSEHTAGVGNEVDVSTLPAHIVAAADEQDDEQQAARARLQAGRRVRQLYIEDVNQLPVVRATRYEAGYETELYAHTLAACFRAWRVPQLIQATRVRYRRMAERRMRAMESGQATDGESEEEAVDEAAVLAGLEEVDADEVFSDRDGALFEYANPLMKLLLQALRASAETSH